MKSVPKLRIFCEKLLCDQILYFEMLFDEINLLNILISIYIYIYILIRIFKRFISSNSISKYKI